MAICIYKTDISWHTYLHGINSKEAYFWRSRMDKLGVEVNDWFYFMCREQNEIVGRGRFRGLEESSISKAWHDHGDKCGASNFVDLQSLIKVALKLENNDDEIQCIILNNVQWLPKSRCFLVEDELFSSINAECPFRTYSISEQTAIALNNKFYNTWRRNG